MSLDKIIGWFNFEDVYRDAVREAPRDAVLVEVGVFFGKSLAFLAREAIDQKRDDLVILGVDPWDFGLPHPDTAVERVLEANGGSSYSSFLSQMSEHALEELHRVRVERMTGALAARKLAAAGVSPWFVFIDADHSYEGVKGDIGAFRPLMQPGSVLAGHDYDPQFPGVAQAVDEAFGPGHRAPPSSWRVTL
jgi:cephalosporin hydroxylase